MWNLIEPLHLWFAVAPLGAAVYFVAHRRARGPRLLRLGGRDQALKRQRGRTRWIFRGLFAAPVVGLVLLALAASRPSMVTAWSKRQSDGIDIVVVLDVSESMDATDFTPNRMTAAKKVIADFVSRRPDDRIGLVIFGGEAVTKSPITRDYDFLLSQVEDSRMRELKQGTAIGMGLANGIGRLRHSESKTKILILITDGDSNVGAINPITAANLARQEGIKIYAIGVGREDRVLVPIYAYDIYGRKTQMVAQVPSYINPELLKEIAKTTGARAYMARDNGMLGRVLAEIDRLERTRVKMLPMQKREELFFWPALVGTLLVALSLALQETRFRRIRSPHAA